MEEEEELIFGPEIPALDVFRTKFCVCDKPNDDKQYYYCVSCENWYHDSCVDINKLHVNKDDDYICPFCANAFPCANTNCNNSAVQVFGELQSKYCSFNCSVAFANSIVIDPMLDEIKDIPKRYKKESKHSATINNLKNDIQSAEESTLRLVEYYDYYENQLKNWPWVNEDEITDQPVCEFSMEYLSQLSKRMPLTLQPVKSTCHIMNCARHDSWKKNLHEQYKMSAERYLMQMDHFMNLKETYLDEIKSYNKSLHHSMRFYSVKR